VPWIRVYQNLSRNKNRIEQSRAEQSRLEFKRKKKKIMGNLFIFRTCSWKFLETAQTVYQTFCQSLFMYIHSMFGCLVSGFPVNTATLTNNH
jgi:hypothetical protein